ncbi:unnamed protein product [Prunus armeniaca]
MSSIHIAGQSRWRPSQFGRRRCRSRWSAAEIGLVQLKFTRRREPRKHEVKVFLGNEEQVDVEAVGVVQLKLDSGFILELDDIVLVPSMKRNLISVSRLSRLGYVFQFNKDGFALSHNSNVLTTGFLSNGLYCLNYNKEGEFLMAESSEKRIRSEGISTRLWHRHLGHISTERMKILVKEQILPSLTFTNDKIFIECVKGKLTKTKKKCATHSSDLLEIIHTDICGPFPHQTIDGNHYFITFIDDHYRFGYLYLIPEKSQAFEMFKIFQTEVERQLQKKIKIVRSDKGVNLMNVLMKEDEGLDLLLGICRIME